MTTPLIVLLTASVVLTIATLAFESRCLAAQVEILRDMIERQDAPFEDDGDPDA